MLLGAGSRRQEKSAGAIAWAALLGKDLGSDARPADATAGARDQSEEKEERLLEYLF
jgi:hypothetical protein